MKNKIKLSLIDDYINIFLINNFCSNKFSTDNVDISTIQLIERNKQTCKMLIKAYCNLINILKLNDVSFFVLNEDLKTNNNLYLTHERENFLNINKTCAYLSNKLVEIQSNLSIKLKKLKLNKTITNNNW